VISSRKKKKSSKIVKPKGISANPQIWQTKRFDYEKRLKTTNLILKDFMSYNSQKGSRLNKI